MSLTSTRERDTVLVRRPVRVERVPDGTPLELAPDTWAQVTQALGSSFTLVADGQLVRLPGRDADAIGREPPQAPVIPADVAVDDVRALVWQTLKTCYDPEIPVDIVELGLVYGCDTRWPTRCWRCRAWPRSRSTWCSTRPGTARACPKRRC